MDFHKMMLLHLMAFLNVLKIIFAVVGGVGVGLGSYVIGETWYLYIVDPKKNAWDKNVRDTVIAVTVLFLAATFCGMAWGCHILLLMTKNHHQKYIRKHPQDGKVRSVAASLLDENNIMTEKKNIMTDKKNIMKDMAIVNIL